MNNLMRVCCLFFTAFLLVGCVTNEDYFGKGPITLSPVVQAGFEDYKKVGINGYFAITEDGRHYGYSFCRAGTCGGNALWVALESCESRSQGRDCKIYAERKTVVWRKHLSNSANRPTRVSDSANSKPKCDGSPLTALAPEDPKELQHYENVITAVKAWDGCIGTHTQGVKSMGPNHIMTYSGMFKNGKPHGSGTLTWLNGDKYVGEFESGNRHGQGKLTYSNGTVKEGLWRNDKF